MATHHAAPRGRFQRTMPRWMLTTSLGAAAVLAFEVPAVAGPPHPPCFGDPKVITGSGTFEGTPCADILIGSDGVDVIDGKGGDDLIVGLGGDDILVGGRGDDKVVGGAGGDVLVGDVRSLTGDATGGADDVLLGGDGPDFIVGDSRAQDGDAAGGGDDRIEGGSGDDIVVGDSDSVTGRARGAGDDRVVLQDGMDRVVGDSNAPSVAGGNGGDDFLDLGRDGGFLAIGDHATFTEGSTAFGAGDDTLVGGAAGEGFLIGDSYADVVSAAGADLILGRGGDDTLFGDNVTVFVVPVDTVGGNDHLRGGAGNDRLWAGPGDDVLDGGPHTDACDGDGGSDEAVDCETTSQVP